MLFHYWTFISSKPVILKCCPGWTGGSSFPWELVRNENSWAPLQICRIRISGWGGHLAIRVLKGPPGNSSAPSGLRPMLKVLQFIWSLPTSPPPVGQWLIVLWCRKSQGLIEDLGSNTTSAFYCGETWSYLNTLPSSFLICKNVEIKRNSSRWESA